MTQLRWMVTGCSSGIGDSLVRCLLARGDMVVATARGDLSRLASLKEAGAQVVVLDVTASALDLKAVVAEILVNGPIDVLVNNAGYIEAGIAEETSLEGYMAQFETNFFGVIKTTQAVLPHFRERKSGSIVFIGSMGGISGEAFAGPYCASKFALEGWYDSLKQETNRLGIKTMIFELGFFRTKLMDPGNIGAHYHPISDYEEIRSAVTLFVQGMNGQQPGDPKKAATIIIDLVRGEGVAEDKTLPDRLPLGPDSLLTMRKKAVHNLSICNEWEEIVGSTNFD